MKLIRVICLFLSLFSFLSAEQSNAVPAEKDERFYELIVVPPYIAHDWDTPRGLFLSQIDNIINVALTRLTRSTAHKSAYGHAMIHLKCADEGQEPFEEWSGFTGDHHGEGGGLTLKKGAGLGVLLYQFEDGEVQSTDEVLKYIRKSKKVAKARPHLMRVPLSKNQCDLMKCHLKAFQSKQHLTYGFTAKPLSYEGAGCTSYAESFLQVAGAQDPIYDRWIRKVEISSGLVGTATLQAKHGFYPIHSEQKAKVGLGKILALSKHSEWRFAGFPNYELNLFDPMKMAQFIEDAEICSWNRSRCDPEMLAWVQKRGVWPMQNANGLAIQLNQLSENTASAGSSECAAVK